MPGILQLGEEMGASAARGGIHAAETEARNDLFNRQIKQQNLEAIGKVAGLAMTAGDRKPVNKAADADAGKNLSLFDRPSAIGIHSASPAAVDAYNANLFSTPTE